MNNYDNAQFAILLNHGIRMEMIASAGDLLDIYYYQFTIYIKEVQELYTGSNIEEYDGIHQFDYEDYVGIGYTLKEAWDDFKEKNSEFLEMADSYGVKEGIVAYAEEINEKNSQPTQ